MDVQDFGCEHLLAAEREQLPRKRCRALACHLNLLSIAPQWVFGISVILMIAVSVVALVSDRRSAARRAPAPLQAAASAD